MKRRWHKLPPEVRRDIVRLAAQGLSRDEIRLQIDCAVGTVVNVLRPLGGVYRPVMWQVSTARLGLPERVDIRIGLERDWSIRRIAASLGRAPSTVSREVAANGGRAGYQPFTAHDRACLLAKRPKSFKLAGDSALLDRVSADLERLWSPRQIAKRLREGVSDGVCKRGSLSH